MSVATQNFFRELFTLAFVWNGGNENANTLRDSTLEQAVTRALWQLDQVEQVANKCGALVDFLRELLDRVAVCLDEAIEAFGVLEVIQVLTLQIFNDHDLICLSVAQFAHNRRHFF
jgi:hypothetical protein